jgi:hypothetical protein
MVKKASKNKSYWIKNTKGEPSMSATFATVAFVASTLVYFGSAFEKLGPISMRAFDAGACGAYLIPILTLYFGRRWTDSKAESDKKSTTTQE